MLSNSTLSDHLWTQTIAGWCRFEGALTLVCIAAFSILPDYIPLDMQVASFSQATISCVCVLLEVCRTGRNLQHPSTSETIQARDSIGTTLPLKTGTVLTDWAG